MKHELEVIKKLIARFGEDYAASKSVAADLEVRLDETLGHHDAVDAVVLMLASYRPEGGDFMYDFDQVKLALANLVPLVEEQLLKCK